jgi:hypothetical protein
MAAVAVTHPMMGVLPRLAAVPVTLVSDLWRQSKSKYELASEVCK